MQQREHTPKSGFHPNPRRWVLWSYDTLIYAFVALFILVIYPSHLDRLNPPLAAVHILVSYGCIVAARMAAKVYSQIWRYAGAKEYIRILAADAAAAAVFILLRFLFPRTITFVRAVSLFTLNLLACIAIRLLYQWVYQNRTSGGRIERTALKLLRGLTGAVFADEQAAPGNPRVKIAIIGAGSVGAMLADELLQNPKATYEPVCFVDIDREKVGREVYGIPVLPNGEGLHERLLAREVQEVVFALPNTSSERRQELYSRYQELGYKIKAYDYPTFNDDGKRVLHDFNIEDLLFRSPAEFLTEETKEYYHNKHVLITGGGGSIGSELARQIARCRPARLVLLDVYENGVYEIQQELLRKYPDLNIRVEIVNVCNRDMLDKVFADHTPDIVLHAAAHKHVPLMERNVCEAVLNNVFGTLNLVEICEQHGVSRFIMISTDKAVNPTNVMGASKRIAEIYVQSLNFQQDTTKFITTRFGNVLGTNGSVIPIFKKQIENGGPVTVTHPDITRFFMTIPEACQLVINAGAMGNGGEIFIFDMGQPVKIYDLAVKMIKLSGLTLGKDIQIKFTGLRPGEKLYEELLANKENTIETKNSKIMIAKVRTYNYDEVVHEIDELIALKDEDPFAIVKKMKEIVPEYISKNSAFEVLN